ncbi:MAG: sugar ABC transporter permease [Acidimicrobiia bacterium]|nr:sugar ABC transporter permease [Acidimicrobiia bacterium]MDH4306655.1 sugar ABC transporter permease [Acidimicrobiia bacterium]
MVQEDTGLGLDDRDLMDGTPPTNPFSVHILRVVAALVIPIATLLGMWVAMNWVQNLENRFVTVIVAIVVGVGGVWLLYWAMDSAVDQLPLRFRESVRPYVFVGPALVLLILYLVYPAFYTFVLSFQDAKGSGFVGLENYAFVFTDERMLRSIRNSIGWIIVVPLVSVVVGLGFALLADRLKRMESAAKALIFLPMAISFVGASIVWKFIYSFRPEGFGEQIGLLNGIMVALGQDPVGWLQQQPWNNLLLMVIMIWMQTGFGMVILSAAIKGVPEDIMEAARIDGATEPQVFWRVIIPSIASTIVVVLTTMTINVLKIFDIVWLSNPETNGTEVIAERMMRWFFRNEHDGRGAAIAVFLFVAILPVMILNIRRFRREEAIR